MNPRDMPSEERQRIGRRVFNGLAIASGVLLAVVVIVVAAVTMFGPDERDAYRFGDDHGPALQGASTEVYEQDGSVWLVIGSEIELDGFHGISCSYTFDGAVQATLWDPDDNTTPLADVDEAFVAADFTRDPDPANCGEDMAHVWVRLGDAEGWPQKVHLEGSLTITGTGAVLDLAGDHLVLQA